MTKKLKTETPEEKEILDTIKTRKQVVAEDNLREAVKECERVGLKVEVKVK